jgi:hypothetical protein
VFYIQNIWIAVLLVKVQYRSSINLRCRKSRFSGTTSVSVMVTELHWVCGIWSFLSSQVMIIVWKFYRLRSALAEPNRFRRRQLLSLYFKIHSNWYNTKTIASLHLIWNPECGWKYIVPPHSAYYRGKLTVHDSCEVYTDNPHQIGLLIEMIFFLHFSGDCFDLGKIIPPCN